MTYKRVINDTESPIEDTLQAQQADNSTTDVDISGFNEVEIHISKPGGAIDDTTSGNVRVDDAANGKVAYDFAQGDLDVTGTYRYEWEVTFSGGGVETFPGDGFGEIKVLPENN